MAVNYGMRILLFYFIFVLNNSFAQVDEKKMTEIQEITRAIIEIKSLQKDSVLYKPALKNEIVRTKQNKFAKLISMYLVEGDSILFYELEKGLIKVLKVEVSTVNELVTPNSFHTTILPVPSFDFSIQKVHYSYQNICV